MVYFPTSEFSGIRALTAEWLYSPWTKEKYDTYLKLNSIGPIHDYFNYLLDLRQDQEYMNRHQLDWSDIHDPRKLRQTSSTSALYGNGINFVSSNIKRLYS